MIKRFAEKQTVVRQSSRTETTPLSTSYEACAKLRKEREDETAAFADARAKAARQDRCQHKLSVSKEKQSLTKPGLFLTHIFSKFF